MFFIYLINLYTIFIIYFLTFLIKKTLFINLYARNNFINLNINKCLININSNNFFILFYLIKLIVFNNYISIINEILK